MERIKGVKESGKGSAREKPKGDRGNASASEFPPVLFGLCPRICAPRPIKINIRTNDKEK